MATQREKFPIGARVSLGVNAFPHVKIREWKITKKLDNGKFLLECVQGKRYTLEVEETDLA